MWTDLFIHSPCCTKPSHWKAEAAAGFTRPTLMPVFIWMLQTKPLLAVRQTQPLRVRNILQANYHLTKQCVHARAAWPSLKKPYKRPHKEGEKTPNNWETCTLLPVCSKPAPLSLTPKCCWMSSNTPAEKMERNSVPLSWRMHSRDMRLWGSSRACTACSNSQHATMFKTCALASSFLCICYFWGSQEAITLPTMVSR